MSQQQLRMDLNNLFIYILQKFHVIDEPYYGGVLLFTHYVFLDLKVIFKIAFRNTKEKVNK